MSKQDDERFWNFVVYKIWATDKEMEEMAPFYLVLFGILAIGFGIYYFFF